MPRRPHKETTHTADSYEVDLRGYGLFTRSGGHEVKCGESHTAVAQLVKHGKG